MSTTTRKEKKMVFSDGFECSKFVDALKRYGIGHDKKRSARVELDQWLKEHAEISSLIA